MTQAELPPDEPPPSGRGARHSIYRIARPTLSEQVWRFLETSFGSRTARAGLVRRLVAPLVIALVPFYWVADATYRSSLTTIGRDQGIFHYIAWAVLRGDVDYRDIRDVNGPLVHLLHMIMLRLGAADEHRFHVLDLAATGLSFAVVGWLLPGVVTRRAPRVLERIAWALAAWVALAGQYAGYLYWNQAQRESFSDWFLLPSIALQIARPREDRHRTRIVLVAALSTLTWFAKPSFVLFTALQLLVVLADDDPPFSRWERFKSFFLGGVLGALVPMLYLFAYGDAASFLRITLNDVPKVYRFIWARSAPEILGDDGTVATATIGVTIAVLLAALVAMRNLPRRMLALAFAPIAGILGAVAQHKGFGYHFHPLTATTHMGCLVLVALVWERYRFAPRRKPLGQWVALGVAGGYAFLVASSMRQSPHTKNVWILAGGEDEKARMEREYFDSFKTYDFFPWELRQGAAYLTQVTGPNARVQMYGMDPYLLYLAQRRSATPYIYAYDLNADAALEGGWGSRPTPTEAAVIHATRDAHEKDMLTRLKASPPEAFVFIDRSPLISYQEAWDDFRHCCNESAVWVAQHYHAARTFEVVHVWLRNDLPVPDHESGP